MSCVSQLDFKNVFGIFTPAFFSLGVSRFYTCNTLSPVAVRAPLTVEQYEATIERSIPAEWHFSDHVPVGGIFQLSECKPSQDVLADVAIV